MSDLDAMTDLALAAMPDDPIFPYRYRYAKSYPEEHRKYTRMRYSEYLANQQAGLYEIILAEIDNNGEVSTPTIAAMTIWLLPGTLSIGPESAAREPSQRLDCDPARVKAFRQKLGDCNIRWFDEVYGDKQQLRLTILGTHPDYRQRALATKLVQWGIAKSEEERTPITLFASPMGKKLYNKLGFKEIGSEKIQVPGDEAFVNLLGMVRECS